MTVTLQVDGLGTVVVVLGHTHMPFDRLHDRRRVVNPGSVGMPYGHAGAAWALLGPGVELRRTSYAAAAAAARLVAGPWPRAAWWAETFVLQPRCSCPDWADPCKHAAAVCYLVADVLDTDPFALLLLRGRSRDEVLAGLRSRRRPSAASTAQATPPEPALDPGIDAREAYRRPVATLPAVPLPPQRPCQPGRGASMAEPHHPRRPAAPVRP
jgi:hypothetical protein